MKTAFQVSQHVTRVRVQFITQTLAFLAHNSPTTVQIVNQSNSFNLYKNINTLTTQSNTHLMFRISAGENEQYKYQK